MEKKPRLSEAARQKKKEYNKAYGERTGHASKKKYQETHKDDYKKMLLCYHREKDRAIVQKLEAQTNKSDYIRQLILADIAKQSDENK
jgi:hypothetical protein